MTFEEHGRCLDIEAHDEGWMRALPPDIRAQFAMAKVRASLACMPDSTPVDVDLAAVYLCTSPATLKRMRSEGTGPAYQQPQTNAGTTARNQKIVYLMGELKRWVRAQQTSSTMHAAELRGTMFTSLQSMGNLEPFWITNHKGVEAVLGHVLGASLTSDLTSGSEAHIEWLDWGQALALPWTDAAGRMVFEVPLRQQLLKALDECNSGSEATQLIAGF